MRVELAASFGVFEVEAGLAPAFLGSFVGGVEGNVVKFVNALDAERHFYKELDAGNTIGDSDFQNLYFKTANSAGSR